MSGPSHTPGPWIVGPFDMIWPASDVEFSDGKWREKIPEPRIIASASKGNLLPDEDRANARLIAAAPDLLAALKAMVLNDRHTYRDCHKAALAAIAKADPASLQSLQTKEQA